jgi:hypothetical protein
LLPDVTCNANSQKPVFNFKSTLVRTAENVEALTPLPHENFPLETPQLPFEDFKVKLEPDPESVYVAKVCVDQVPAERRPPVVLALIMALVGRLPGAYRKGDQLSRIVLISYQLTPVEVELLED